MTKATMMLQLLLLSSCLLLPAEAVFPQSSFRFNSRSSPHPSTTVRFLEDTGDGDGDRSGSSSSDICYGMEQAETEYNDQAAVLPYSGMFFYVSSRDKNIQLAALEMDMRTDILSPDEFPPIQIWACKFDVFEKGFFRDEANWDLLAETHLIPHPTDTKRFLFPSHAFLDGPRDLAEGTKLALYIRTTDGNAIIDNTVNTFVSHNEIAESASNLQVFAGYGLEEGAKQWPFLLPEIVAPVFAGRFYLNVESTFCSFVKTLDNTIEFLTVVDTATAVSLELTGLDDALDQFLIDTLLDDTLLVQYAEQYNLRINPSKNVKTGFRRFDGTCPFAFCQAFSVKFFLLHDETISVNAVQAQIYKHTDWVTNLVHSYFPSSIQKFNAGLTGVQARFTVTLQNIPSSVTTVLNQKQQDFLLQELKAYTSVAVPPEFAQLMKVVIQDQKFVGGRRQLRGGDTTRTNTPRSLEDWQSLELTGYIEGAQFALEERQEYANRINAAIDGDNGQEFLTYFNFDIGLPPSEDPQLVGGLTREDYFVFSTLSGITSDIQTEFFNVPIDWVPGRARDGSDQADEGNSGEFGLYVIIGVVVVVALLCTVAIGRFLSGGWLWFLKCCETCEKDRFKDKDDRSMNDDEIEAAYLKEFEAKHGGLKDAVDTADEEKSVPSIITATSNDPEQALANRQSRRNHGSTDETVDTSDPSTDDRPMSPNQGSHGNVEEADDEVDAMVSPQAKTPKAYKKYWASDESDSEVESPQKSNDREAAPATSVDRENIEMPADSPMTEPKDDIEGKKESGPNVWPPVIAPDISDKEGDHSSDDDSTVEEFQDEAEMNVLEEPKTREAPPSPSTPVESTTTSSSAQALDQLYANEEDDEDIPLPPDAVLLGGSGRAPLEREAPPRRPPTRSDDALPRGKSYKVHSEPLAPVDDHKPTFTMAELRSFGISKLKAMCKQYEIVYDMHEIFEKEDLVQVLVTSSAIRINREAPTRSRSADAVDMGDMRSSLMMAPSCPRSMSRDRVSKPRRAKSADLTSMANAAAVSSSSPKKSSSSHSRSSHRSSSRDKTRSSSHDRRKSSRSKSSRSKVKRSSSSDDVLLATAAAARDLSSSPASSSASKSSSSKKKSSSSNKGSLDRKLSRSKSDDLASMRKKSSSASSTASDNRGSSSRRRSKSKDRSSKSKRRSRSSDDALSRSKSKHDKNRNDEDNEDDKEEDGYDAFENEIFGDD